MPPLSLVIFTLAGGTLLAISANVMNQVFEVETDKLMERTSDRPIVTGELTKTNGIIYSISSGLIGFLILYFLVTPLSSFIGLAANIFYVFIYTLILKPRTNQNIVIGGASGAAPVLIGWTEQVQNWRQDLGFYSYWFLCGHPHISGHCQSRTKRIIKMLNFQCFLFKKATKEHVYL